MNDKEISKLADTLTAVAEMRKSEKTLTTAELAKQLNTSPKVILQNARRCLPNKKIENGKPTFWSEAEVTLLSHYIKNDKQSIFLSALPTVNLNPTVSKAITTSEIARQLNTSKNVVLSNARKCLPNKVIEHGKPVYWNEQEVTILLDYIKKNPITNSTDDYVVSKSSTTTSLTPALKIKQAMILMQEGYEEELARIASEKKNLEIELDKAKEFITVKRMEKLNPTMHFDWRLLKKESIRLGEAMKDTFDQNYGTVKAYHKNVWESLYYDSINYPA